MKHVEVAVGIVIRQPHEVLVCQRCKGDTFADLWEFPGGKLEPGESPTAALHRELLEELSITVAIDRPLTPLHHTYPTFEVTLHPFLCHLLTGHPQPHASQQLRWVPLDKLSDHPFPEANTPLLRELLATFAPTPTNQSMR